MNHSSISWKIAPEPATLTRDEFWARYDHINMPEKFEATGGKLGLQTMCIGHGMATCTIIERI